MVMLGHFILIVLPLWTNMIKLMVAGTLDMYAREFEQYSNRLADTGITLDYVGCFITCQSRGNCIGLFYSQSTSTCYGYGTRMYYSTNTLNVAGMKYFESTGRSGNIAVNKTTFHSTQLWNNNLFGSYRAVDGSRNNLQDDNKCFHSNTDKTPWMIVDLGQSYTIFDVAILARKECCPERMAKMTISVGDDVNNINTLCYYYEGPGYINLMETFECNKHVNGRYVRVQRSELILNVCELEVYGD